MKTTGDTIPLMAEPPPSNRPALLRFGFVLLVLTIGEAFAIWGIIAGMGHSHPLVGVVFGAFVLAYVGIVAFASFHYLWNPVLAPYPPRDPAPDAVRRRCQSFGLGCVNMSGSVHVAVDEEYLHMTPLAIWRMLGANAASIPWSALTALDRSGRFALLGACRLHGPKWCMELAQPKDD